MTNKQREDAAEEFGMGVSNAHLALVTGTNTSYRAIEVETPEYRSLSLAAKIVGPDGIDVAFFRDFDNAESFCGLARQVNRLTMTAKATDVLMQQSGVLIETQLAELERLREALQRLCDRLGEMEGPVNAIIGVQVARTGHGYAGPNWGEPLKIAQAALAAGKKTE